MAPSQGTRARIVDAAAELFHRHGFQGTSLAAVQELANVRGGSLYYFFRTKEDLLEAALGRYAELLDPVVMEPAFARTNDPVERIFAVLDRYRTTLLETDFALGCPIGNLAVEMVAASPEARHRLVDDFTLWARRVEACLAEATDRLPPSANRRRLALFVLTVMEGAVLLARGHRDIRPFDDAVAELRDCFDRLSLAAAAESDRRKPRRRPS